MVLVPGIKAGGWRSSVRPPMAGFVVVAALNRTFASGRVAFRAGPPCIR
jgi:hypothetical protein